MEKFIKYMFVGPFTEENIPNRRVRHTVIMVAYQAFFYQIRSAYYRDKIRVMEELNVSELSLRDWLRHWDFESTATVVDMYVNWAEGPTTSKPFDLNIGDLDDLSEEFRIAEKDIQL